MQLLTAILAHIVYIFSLNMQAFMFFIDIDFKKHISFILIKKECLETVSTGNLVVLLIRACLCTE